MLKKNDIVQSNGSHVYKDKIGVITAVHDLWIAVDFGHGVTSTYRSAVDKIPLKQASLYLLSTYYK